MGLKEIVNDAKQYVVPTLVMLGGVGALIGANYVFGDNIDGEKKLSLGIGATASTLLAGAGLAIQYARGKWPFYRIDDNVYIPLQWFNKSIGRVLKGPGTRLLIRPLEDIAEEGEARQVPGESRPRDLEMKFNTSDPLDGTIKLQYIYAPTGKKGAKKFYWQYGNDVSAVDQEVMSSLKEEIGARDYSKVLAGDYKVDTIKGANADLEQAGFGLEVKALVTLDVELSEASKEIVSKPIKALKEAEALITRSRAEIEAAENMKLATLKTTEGYIEAGEMYASAGKAGEYALHLWRGDNNQQISEKGRLISIDGGISPPVNVYNQMPQQAPIQNPAPPAGKLNADKKNIGDYVIRKRRHRRRRGKK